MRKKNKIKKRTKISKGGKKARIIELNSNVYFSLNVNDNIFFKTQKDVFNFLNIKDIPNFKGYYEFKNSIFAIWFPNFPFKNNVANNFLSIDQNVITEKLCSNIIKNESKFDQLFLITFAKSDSKIKFIGIYRVVKSNKKNTRMIKVSNNIVIGQKV